MRGPVHGRERDHIAGSADQEALSADDMHRRFTELRVNGHSRVLLGRQKKKASKQMVETS